MILWIAGWPHNGSTLCRQMLRDSFGIKTYSRYLESELESLFEGGQEFYRKWSANPLNVHRYLLEHDNTWVIKTHELPLDNAPTLFVVRDGRDAVCSLSNFWSIPINQAITGLGCAFGTWSSYYYGWMPHKRENTLLLRFEDMVERPNEECGKIAEFLGVPQEKPYVDDFEEKKKQYPFLFKDRIGVWRNRMNKEQLNLFDECHGKLMRELCYEV
jgi:hypothetical protein